MEVGSWREIETVAEPIVLSVLIPSRFENDQGRGLPGGHFFTFKHIDRRVVRRSILNPQERNFNLQSDSNGSKISTLLTLVLACLVALLGGCRKSDVVQGQPRSSSKTMVTASDAGDDLSKPSAIGSVNVLRREDREFDLSFLHQDHFAVAVIDVLKIYKNEDLNDFNWNRFTRLLQPYVGYANAHPEKLSAVWILCDREIADADKAEDAKESDFVVFVVDFLEPFNPQGLQRELKNRARSASASADDPWRSEVRIRSDRRIAIGTAAMLDKLDSVDAAGEVAASIANIEPEVDIAISVSFEPVRGAMKGVIAMATQFLGAEMKPLLQLPTSAQLFNATLSLSSQRLLMTDLQMNSSDAAGQVTEVWAKLLGSGSIGQLLTLFSLQFGTQNRMFELKSLPVLNRISRQIEASRLYQVRNEGPAILSQFTRPRDFGTFLRASVDDVERSLALVNRMKQMREIANALKSYEQIHGHLPAPTFVNGGGQSATPFSWRTELLPLLGRQAIFNKIDFTQPWDSQANRKVRVYIVSALHDRRELNPMTVMFPVNPDWMFPDRAQRPKLSSIADQRQGTAIALEARVSKPFHYFQPVDLTLDDLSLWGREDEAGVVFIDGNFDVRVIKKSEENMKSVLSIDSGSRLKRSDFIKVLGFSNN